MDAFLLSPGTVATQSPTHLWSPVPLLTRRNNALALVWTQLNSLLSEPRTSAGCLLKNQAVKHLLPLGLAQTIQTESPDFVDTLMMHLIL